MDTDEEKKKKEYDAPRITEWKSINKMMDGASGL